MANKGLSMRKVREVLRLHYAAGLSTRAIARSLKVSPATVGKYIRRAEVQSLSWPLPEPLDDAALERRLFPAPVLSATQRPLPEWSEVHRELRQKDVTLALLWQESSRRPYACSQSAIRAFPSFWNRSLVASGMRSCTDRLCSSASMRSCRWAAVSRHSGSGIRDQAFACRIGLESTVRAIL